MSAQNFGEGIRGSLSRNLPKSESPLSRSIAAKSTCELKMSDILQFSMDGPNVNWSFQGQLASNYQEEFETKMLNPGSCGLHVINDALKTGHNAGKWKVQQTLKSFLLDFQR